MGLFALYAIAVGAFLVSARRRAHETAGADAASDARRRLTLAGAACALLYLASPRSMGGATLIHQRFLAFGCAILVVVLAPPRTAAFGVTPPLAAVAALAGVLGTAVPSFVDAARGTGALDRLIAQVARASAVAQLDLTPRAPSAVAPVPGAAARVLAERGGRLLFSFASAPASVVVFRPGEAWDEARQRMVVDPLAFAPAYDFERFRYALVRVATPSPRWIDAIVHAMAPEGRLVDAAGEWLLFASALPVVSPEAPDAPLPSPAPASLADRIAASR